MVYYAVAKGHATGLFSTWLECKKNIDGFKGAVYKKFETEQEALDFIETKTRKEGTKSVITEITDIGNNTPDYYVYTDGSCINNGRPDARAGIGIYFSENDPRNVSQPIQGKQTNNTAELSAIIHLHKLIESDINSGKKIAIVSDSEYAIRCATAYGKRCAKEGWTKDMPNKELVKQIYELYKDKPNAQFLHIMAHTEKTDTHSLGNDGADRLANQALGLETCPYATQNSIFAEAKAVKATKHYLYVPYEQKEFAKAKGSQWDFKKKMWFIYANNPHQEELQKMFGRN